MSIIDMLQKQKDIGSDNNIRQMNDEESPNQVKSPNNEEVLLGEKEFKPPLKLKVMIGGLYFLQGVLLSLPSTMILVYLQLPPKWIISIFSAASLPFSFKFVTAPLIEKYTFINYGKRKTWIIISQLLSSLLLFLASFLTDQYHEVAMAILFIFIIFFITLQDISLDAVAIKELRVPYLAALLQGIMQTVGLVVGGLCFLKATSAEFAEQIGLSGPMTTPAVMLRVVCGLIFIPTVLIHFGYGERILDSERTVREKSMLEIVGYYREFFKIRTRYCRTFLMFLCYWQGFVLFEAYYEYELIEHHQVSRNLLNTITNIVLVPTIIISLVLTPRIERMGWLWSTMACMIARWVVLLFILLFFPTSVAPISLIFFFLQLLETFRFILTSILINSFPVMGLSGMFITMMNSSANLGRNSSLHILLTGVWGWKVSAIVGLFLQVIIIGFFPRFFKELQEGTLEIQGMEETMKKQKRQYESKQNKQIQMQQISKKSDQKENIQGYRGLNEQVDSS